jgi:hypothetical protein
MISLTRKLPLYLRKDGTAISARLSLHKEKWGIVQKKEWDFSKPVDRFRLFDRSVVGVTGSIFSRIELDNSDYKMCKDGSLFSYSLKETLEHDQTLLGSNLSSVKPESIAVLELLKLVLSDKNISATVIYECEEVIKCAVTVDGEFITVVSLPDYNSSTLKSIDLWLKREQIDIPKRIIVVGTLAKEDDKELTKDLEHIFPNDSLESIAAAGALMGSSFSKGFIAEKKNSDLFRKARLTSFVISALLLLTTLIFSMVSFVSLGRVERELIEESSTLNPKVKIQIRESSKKLIEITKLLSSQQIREQNSIKWSGILVELSKCKPNGVTLHQFDSRSTGTIGTIDLSLSGTGKSEKDINSFVNSLKSSPFMEKISLKRLEKGNKNEYRFSVLCRVK